MLLFGSFVVWGLKIIAGRCLLPLCCQWGWVGGGGRSERRERISSFLPWRGERGGKEGTQRCFDNLAPAAFFYSDGERFVSDLTLSRREGWGGGRKWGKRAATQEKKKKKSWRMK